MTYEQLLKKVGEGKMPEVKTLVKIKYATSDVGRVTTIKDNGRHRGIAVRFPGCDWDTWFHDNTEGSDKRTLYLHQLQIVNP